MTDVSWSKDAPTVDGYYWAQFPDSKPFLRMVCAAWRQRHGSALSWGPRIPSPEALAEVVEFLRCVAMPGVDVEKYADGSCGSEEWARWSVAARALLAKLENT